MPELTQRILATFDDLKRDRLDLHTFFELVAGAPPEERAAVLDAVGGLVQDGSLETTGGVVSSATLTLTNVSFGGLMTIKTATASYGAVSAPGRMSRPAWILGDGPEQLSYAATSSFGV